MVLPRNLALALALTVIPFCEAGADADHVSEGEGSALNVGELQRLMDALVSEVLAATDASDLDWRMSDLIAGGPLEQFLHAALTAVSHVPTSELEVNEDELDDDLQEAAPYLRLGLELVAEIGRAREEGSTERESSSLLGMLEGLDLQELLYGERVPEAVQRALYEGQVSYVCLLALVSGRTIPEWLRVELRRRLLEGQREQLRILIALARAAELPVPDSDIIATLEPFDFDTANRDSAAQRQAIRSHLMASRSTRSRG